MDITIKLYIFYLYIVNLIKQVINLIQLNIRKKEDIEYVKSPVEIYTEKHQTLFLNSFNTPEETNNNNIKFNYNISNIFYSKKMYQEMLIDENNILEKEWKTRILFENTPRGNIIMYYNPYKLGFTYHCDQNVPYNILNAVAMKYVLKFSCRDFFVDEKIVPESSPSPILKLIEEEPKKKTDKQRDENNDSIDNKDKLKKSPFAKFKSYNKNNGIDVTSKDVSTKNIINNNNDKNKNEKQKESNRFINLGKISNFQLLQPTKIKKTCILFKSNLMNSLFENASTQKEVMNYRDFKKLQKNSTSGSQNTR